MEPKSGNINAKLRSGSLSLEKQKQKRLYVNEAVTKKEILNSLPENADNVRILSVGNKEKVFFDSIEVVELFREFNFKNPYIFSEIYQEIYKTFPNHHCGTILLSINKKKKSMPNIGDKIDKVDIESCYLRSAFLLGYISKKKYLSLVKRYDEIKIEFCASITSLGRDTKMLYKDRHKTIKCDTSYLKTISDNIINHSHNIMENYTGKFFDKNVDGIIIPHRDSSKLMSYLNRQNYYYTIQSGEFWGNSYITENGNLID